MIVINWFRAIKYFCMLVDKKYDELEILIFHEKNKYLKAYILQDMYFSRKQYLIWLKYFAENASILVRRKNEIYFKKYNYVVQYLLESQNNKDVYLGTKMILSNLWENKITNKYLDNMISTWSKAAFRDKNVSELVECREACLRLGRINHPYIEWCEKYLKSLEPYQKEEQADNEV